MSLPQAPSAIRHLLTGRVQGLGIRPAVARLAQDLQLGGRVGNTPRGVAIEVSGTDQQLQAFADRLLARLPSECRVDEWLQEALEPQHFEDFTIVSETSAGPLTTQVPPDTGLCEACRRESFDELDRRFGYALNSCVTCGPRFSLVEQMPFERLGTTMAPFVLCGDCLREFTCPSDRRYHAQTMGCPHCGPRWWLEDNAGGTVADAPPAFDVAARQLVSGQIVGLKGVGGYQLICDATSAKTVARLRERKGRLAKPFAVLVRDFDHALELAHLSAAEQAALQDASNPIVIVAQRPGSGLAAGVTQNLSTIGLLLPTTAAHVLLARATGLPLVCTSANLEGEPLLFERHAIIGASRSLADLWLHHDRDIARPLDDSVVRVIEDRPWTFRMGRGFAPLRLELPRQTPALALGGHLKSAVAWHNGSQAALGPHIGDLDNLAVRDRYRHQIIDLQRLYGFTPQLWAHDRHPDYFTTHWATQQTGLRTAVQHHAAHVAAVLLEHHALHRTVLGVAWDGAGWGDGHAVWGGEFLRMTLPTVCQRVAHLLPFRLPGGDLAARQPWRVAVAMLMESVDSALWHDELAEVWPEQPVTALAQWLQTSPSRQMTTSAGRLFDAAAALVLGIQVNQYEGQAAMLLESAAASAGSDGPGYPLPLLKSSPVQLDWRPMLSALWDDRRRGVEPATMAYRFHRGLAAGIAAIARRFPETPLALCGGVFQNRLLTHWVLREAEPSREILLPGKIPTNDGGLAAGQLAIALAGTPHL